MAKAPLDLDKLVSALNFASAGLSITFTHGPGTNGTTELSGEIAHGSGNVGNATRRVTDTSIDRHVEATGLWINDPALQGKGFGAAFDAHSSAVFKAHGFDRIFLTTREIGGYAWSRCGYTLAGQGRAPLIDSTRIWYPSGRAWALASVLSGAAQQQDFDALDAEFKCLKAGGRSIIQPQEIETVGGAHPWTENGRTMWLGKKVLIGSKWSGVKYL